SGLPACWATAPTVRESRFPVASTDSSGGIAVDMMTSARVLAGARRLPNAGLLTDTAAATALGPFASSPGSRADLGTLLKRAMHAKAMATGIRYTYRDLERESGIRVASANNLVHGRRQASREVIEALALALAPYLVLQEALGSAGYEHVQRED